MGNTRTLGLSGTQHGIVMVLPMMRPYATNITKPHNKSHCCGVVSKHSKWQFDKLENMGISEFFITGITRFILGNEVVILISSMKGIYITFCVG
jgi:uncharacterized protein YdaU (DUF1376 family)